jgi:hypothetical protein
MTLQIICVELYSILPCRPTLLNEVLTIGICGNVLKMGVLLKILMWYIIIFYKNFYAMSHFEERENIFKSYQKNGL